MHQKRRGVPLEVLELIDCHLGRRSQLRVLDAGCGERSRIDFGERAHVTGIDVSGKSLAQNPNLDERVVADLQTFDIADETFDVIVCWDVLEHLRSPETVLQSFSRATRRSGLIIIAGPNLLSIKGIVTKFTPHAFHSWFYRTFVKFSSREPFKTSLKRSASPKAIMRWAGRERLSIAFVQYYESYVQSALREKLRLTGLVWSLIQTCTRVVTLGRIDAAETDFIMVLQKP
jgi:2-polyprenyl-3-methyl-5-hydroxy-6-metoxy-1,4-benzoquinol methylase